MPSHKLDKKIPIVFPTQSLDGYSVGRFLVIALVPPYI